MFESFLIFLLSLKVYNRELIVMEYPLVATVVETGIAVMDFIMSWM
jgi:hypothetical protein